jgi:hypothetical protein
MTTNLLTLQPQIETWLDHIRMLSVEIGPRGPTTDGERKGSEYCCETLTRFGLSPKLEPFRSARSIFQPHLFASIAMLASFAIYPLMGRTSAALAALISAIALSSDLLELGFRDNLIRRLVSKGDSQNVVAVLSPEIEHGQDLVIIGHVDSQRTPIIFKSKTWLTAYKTFTTVAFIAFTAQVILFVLGTMTQSPWIWPMGALPALCAILLAAMCMQADNTPFTRGANDNATAAGLVLSLAEQLKTEPLRQTRVWFVCSGCEETQHYGAIDFFRRHRAELKRPKGLVFEMLGCGGPAWLTKEGIIIPFHADPGLVRLAEQVALENPELAGYPTSISGGNTEMADALRVGIPAITITGFGPHGEAPYWHQVEDTFDKMDEKALLRNYAFIWSMIRAIDEG